MWEKEHLSKFCTDIEIEKKSISKEAETDIEDTQVQNKNQDKEEANKNQDKEEANKDSKNEPIKDDAHDDEGAGEKKDEAAGKTNDDGNEKTDDENKDNDGKKYGIPDDVQEAYFSFIGEFCPCVSFHWKNYLKYLTDREKATFKNELTQSDETYVKWYLDNHWEDIEQDVEYIKEHSREEFNEMKSKRKKDGQHDTNKFWVKYCNMLEETKAFRKNNPAKYELWQNIFFDKYFESKHPLLAAKRKKRSAASSGQHDPEVPQDFS